MPCQENADKKLADNLRTKFGLDCILILGAHTKFYEPIRGKGNRTMLRKEGFKAYLLNEFKTSSMCPSCNNPKLEKFKDCVNPRPFQHKKRPTVKYHGLLRRPNQKCLKNKALTGEDSYRVYNKDLVAVLNFRQIEISMRENLTRLELLKRKNNKDNIVLKKPRRTE